MEQQKAVVSDDNVLATGKEGKLLFRYAMPCVVALLISALYNVVDQLFIGNSSLGALGNSATTIVFPLTILALALSLLMGDGAAAFLSLCQGKKNTDEAGKAIAGSVTLGLLVSLVFSLVTCLAMNPILGLLGATSDTLDLAARYGLIICGGIVFSVYTNLLNPIIRSDGSPIFAMIAQGVGAVLNIIFDPIFIFPLNMGLEGAAIATLLGQFVSAVLSLLYLKKAKTFRFKASDFFTGMRYLGKTLRLGISSFFIQMSLVAVTVASNLVLVKYGEGTVYGTTIPVAVFGITYKVFTIVVNIPIGVGLGALPIIGYNYGAGNYGRVKKTYLYVLLSTLIVTALATVWFEAAPLSVISLFGTGEETSYYDFGVLCFRVYLSCLILTGLQRTASVFFQALGKPIQATILSLVRDLILLVPLTCLLPIGLGLEGFLISAPIADALAFLLTAGMVLPELSRLGRKTGKTEKKDLPSILPSHPGYIITIAREHGAEGRAIGKALSEKLKIPFYDKEMTALAAERSGFSEEYVAAVEEGNVRPIQDLYCSLDPTEKARSAQREILSKIAEAGSCVIVGRAADDVLAGYPLIRVFLYAPIPFRVKNVMKEYGDDEKDALRHIQRSDERRASYYSLITGKKWGERENYDLLLDSSIGVEEAANLLAQYAEKSPKPGK
jgi:putative MATE family efflux protein